MSEPGVGWPAHLSAIIEYRSTLAGIGDPRAECCNNSLDYLNMYMNSREVSELCFFLRAFE